MDGVLGARRTDHSILWLVANIAGQGPSHSVYDGLQHSINIVFIYHYSHLYYKHFHIPLYYE